MGYRAAFALVLILGLATARAGELVYDRLSVYPVRVAFDAPYRAKYGDQANEIAKALVDKTSALFTRHFGVAFVIADYVDWSSSDSFTKDGFKDVRGKVKPPDGPQGGLVFVFTTKSLREQTDGWVAAGVAQHLWPYFLILDSPLDERNLETVAHEIGHTFGAFHIKEHCRLMSPTDIKGFCANRTRLDEATIAILRITRTYDFRRGPEQLSTGEIDRIGHVYREHRGPGECNPIAKAFVTRAEAAMDDNKLSEARAASTHATKIEPACSLVKELSAKLKKLPGSEQKKLTPSTLGGGNP